jgi:DNA-binding NarL/FixJ family response regulator
MNSTHEVARDRLRTVSRSTKPMKTSSSESISSVSRSGSLRIAIADDDRLMRETLKRMLEDLGHEVVIVAEDGRSLIAGCIAAEPEVVITDQLMPDISGAEVAAIIHQRRPTPVIVVSSYCDRELVLSAEEQQVVVYLVKPLSLDHLRTAVERCRGLLADSVSPGEGAGESAPGNEQLPPRSSVKAGPTQNSPRRGPRRPR